MTTTRDTVSTSTSSVTDLHPLEPLSAEEISRAVAIARQERNLGATFRFPCVTLKEPPKAFVLAYQPGDPFEREVFLILLDNATNQTFEAVVSSTLR